MEPLIRVRDLRFSYPDGTSALAGVDFDLLSGERVVLLGANGSGKTTFMLHLNGLLKGLGEVSVAGHSTGDTDQLARLRRRVGLVFQDPEDQLFMPTVIEDVEFGLRSQNLPGPESRARALRALHASGYTGPVDKPPFHLSYGEKRRVAIAGILAMEPEVLVLDEPTTFMDPPGQRDLVRTLRGLSQAQVIATHDVQFAAAIGTRAVFFQAGKIAATGSVAELTSQFSWGTY